MSSTSSPDDVAEAFSAVAPTYDDHYSTTADLADSTVIFRRARKLHRAGPPGILIDLGCGPGTALRWNVAGPADYIGIDLAEGMIEEARARWPPYTFVHGDHHAIQPSAATFILGGFGPLQYVRPRERPTLASRVVEGLVPGGRFLIMARPRAISTRVLDADLVYGLTAHEARGIFQAAGATEVRVSSHRRIVSRRSPRKVQEMSLRLSRLFPLHRDGGEWLVIEGRRPGGTYRRFT